MVAAVVTYIISALVGTGRSDVTSAAREMSRKVEVRMALLDAYINNMEEDLLHKVSRFLHISER